MRVVFLETQMGETGAKREKYTEKSSLTSNVERKKKRSESSLQGQRVYVTNQITQ